MQMSGNNLERVTGIEPAIFCLGSRRSTTELHPRESRKPAGAFSHKRGVGSRAVLVSVVFIAALGFAPQAHAQIDPETEVLDAETPITADIDVALKNDAQVEVFQLHVDAGVLPVPATVDLSEADVPSIAAPTGWERVSSVFTFDIKTPTRPTFGNSLTLSLKSDQDSLYKMQVFFFDRTSQTWRGLKSTQTIDSDVITANAHVPYAQVALFASHEALLGRASWYRSSRYPSGVASNDFPMGSMLRLTNVANSKSTQVKVVSTGPFVYGRVVDVSLTAFKKIATHGEGIIVVRVELVKSAKTAAAKPASLLTEPKIRGTQGYVIQPSTQVVMYDKASTTVRSLASLTKLMTAYVVLQHNPTLKGNIIFSSADAPVGEQGVAIRVRPGDTLSVRDVFFAMLTGSANNAALALSRSTGLTRAQFLAEMNSQAKTLGMTQTVFVDPSGLEVGNLGTTQDMAKLMNVVLDNAPVRAATKGKTFTYTIRNTGERRLIHNPVYQGSVVLNDEPIIGGKTGYINESLYNLSVGVTIKGQRVIVLVFGSPTRASRNADVETLIHYAQQALPSTPTS